MEREELIKLIMRRIYTRRIYAEGLADDILHFFNVPKRIPPPAIDNQQHPTTMNEALKLLRDLADLQNGPPLEQHRKQWEETMEQVYAFLNRHEGMTQAEAIDILIRHNEWRQGGKGEMVTPEKLGEAIDVVTSGAVFTFSTTDPRQALRWSKADDMASALWELVNNGWCEFEETDYDYERAWNVIHETLEDHQIDVVDIWN